MKKKLKLFALLFICMLILQCKSTNELKNIDKLIIGTWAKNENENVEFIIDKKNIEYFDAEYSYSYKITDKNELLILDSSKVVLIFKVLAVSKDSLFLQSKNDGNNDLIYRYYRRE